MPPCRMRSSTTSPVARGNCIGRCQSSLIGEARFPEGTFHMKSLSGSPGNPAAAYKSLHRFATEGTFEHKVSQITVLMDRFRERQFILIGDSGECDPEIYRQIADRQKRFGTEGSEVQILSPRPIRFGVKPSKRWALLRTGVIERGTESGEFIYANGGLRFSCRFWGSRYINLRRRDDAHFTERTTNRIGGMKGRRCPYRFRACSRDSRFRQASALGSPPRAADPTVS